MSSIYHKHHIVPRHMGGTDDPSNLIELTDETKNKMILAKSGKNNPMFGKKRIMSEEAKRKISETLRRKNLEADRRFALLTSGL